MDLDEYIFQQDNAPCHKSKKTLNFFEQNNVNLMIWPAQSPDLNPIENLWAYMKKELIKYNAKNINELKLRILEIWHSIPADYIEKLVKSMHSRCYEVIVANGGHTSY